MKLDKQQMLIGGQILKEIRARIRFLMDVGLDYLTLGKSNRYACPEGKRRESGWQHRSVPAW